MSTSVPPLCPQVYYLGEAVEVTREQVAVRYPHFPVRPSWLRLCRHAPPATNMTTDMHVRTIQAINTSLPLAQSEQASEAERLPRSSKRLWHGTLDESSWQFDKAVSALAWRTAVGLLHRCHGSVASAVAASPHAVRMRKWSPLIAALLCAHCSRAGLLIRAAEPLRTCGLSAA